MCVIIKIPAGQTFPEENMSNAVYNNEHGAGIIVIKPKKKALDGLELTKFYEKDGISPKQVIDFLRENINYDRILHLRNTSAGDTSEENVQPFTTFDTPDGEKCFFMHNGTLYSYKETNSKMSDSWHFNERVLKKLMSNYEDLDCKFLPEIIHKFWGETYSSTTTGSTGLIVSNLIEGNLLFINESKWTTFKGFKVSNTTYFNILQRGSEFDRRKKIEDLKKAQEKPKPVGRISKTSFEEVADSLFRIHKVDFNCLARMDTIQDIIKGENSNNRTIEEVLYLLKFITEEEFEDLVYSDTESAFTLFKCALEHMSSSKVKH